MQADLTGCAADPLECHADALLEVVAGETVLRADAAT
jgi:hypothetical protein